MEVPSSVPCDPATFIDPPGSSNEDSIRSFKLFLDLITPAEFSKLLRARVGHLLKTWPPLSQDTSSTSSSSSTVHRGPSDPPFESVRAFAAFFRTQDAPGPSPGDVSATSLSTLQHQLLALQTLLSFLSGRELKDIVRARLGEGGKDRAIAVRGLMDVMKDAGSEGEREEEKEAVLSDVFGGEIGHEGKDGAEKGGGSVPATRTISTSGDTVHERETPETSQAEVCETVQPPRKRQRISLNNEHAKEASLSTSADLSHSSGKPQRVATSPMLTNPSPPPHPPPRARNAAAASRVLNEPAQSTGSDPSFPIASARASFGREEDLVDANLMDVDMEISDQDTGASKENREDSEEEDEVGGLVVTLIDEDEEEPASGLSPANSPTHKGHRTVVETAPAVDSATPWPGRTAIDPGSNFEPASPLMLTFGAELHTPTTRTDSKLRTRGNQKQRPQSPGRLEEAWSSQQGQPVARTSRNAPTTAVVANSSPSVYESPFDPVPVHSSASPSTAPELHASRSHSPSFEDSDLDDRASPPGPRLRSAVDWASGVLPSSIDLDMNMHAGGEDDGSDDTLALGAGAVFNPDSNSLSFRKPIPSLNTRKTCSNSHSVDWDADGEQASDTDTNVEKLSDTQRTGTVTGTNGTSEGSAEQPRKLYIRLPARPRATAAGAGPATGIGIEDADSEASDTSSSFAPFPLSEREVKEFMQSIMPDAARSPELPTPPGPHREDGEQSPPAEAAEDKLTPGLASPMATPALAHSGLVANALPLRPPSQAPFVSRTQSASPTILQHGHFPLGPHNPQAATYAHPHPYPWFGAMFYVPVRGHPHPAMQQRASLPKMPSAAAGPSRMPPGVPASPRGVAARAKDQGSGSAHAPTNSGADSATSEARKRAPTRKSSPEPAESGDAYHITPPPMEVDDPDVAYTDDVGVKESLAVKRRCFNCRAVQAPSWRKSKLTVGKILCNKCGIYETTHMSPRPLKTRPRRSQAGADGEASPPKKRKSPKKVQ